MKISNKLNSSIILDKHKSYNIEKSSSNSFELMQKAGLKAAKQIINNYKKQKVLIICGIGGNGGDGFIVAKDLLNKNWKIDVVIIGNKKNIKGDALKALKKLNIKTKEFDDIELEKIDLFVDAIFGLGLSREIKGKTKKILETIDQHSSPIIALDIPSGIDSNTGQILGYAPHCELVITFSSFKYGHIIPPGSEKFSKIKVENIGIKQSVLEDIYPKIEINNPNQWIKNIKWPKIDDHKYSRGYSLIIGGPKNMTGAARLAAKAAQRSGSGIVCVASEKEAEQIYYITLISQLVKSYKNINEFNKIISDKRIDSVLIGPGLSVNQKSILKIKNLLKVNKNTILDAGAISCFKGKLDLLKKILLGKNVIITPHEGELRSIMPYLEGNCIDKALKAASELRCVVILKGPTTVIASPDNRALVNRAGAKWLSTAGSGDVLAGIICGLLSNKMECYLASAFGVWLHSEIGKYLGAGLVAEDIPKNISVIYKKLLKLYLKSSS